MKEWQGWIVSIVVLYVVVGIEAILASKDPFSSPPLTLFSESFGPAIILLFLSFAFGLTFLGIALYKLIKKQETKKLVMRGGFLLLWSFSLFLLILLMGHM